MEKGSNSQGSRANSGERYEGAGYGISISVFLHNGEPVTTRIRCDGAGIGNVAKVDLIQLLVFMTCGTPGKRTRRRSGMHPEIEKAIMGHSQTRKSVHEGYGFISDEELIRAIDAMTFDHGETRDPRGCERKEKSRQGVRAAGSAERCEQNVSNRPSKNTAHEHNLLILLASPRGFEPLSPA